MRGTFAHASMQSCVSDSRRRLYGGSLTMDELHEPLETSPTRGTPAPLPNQLTVYLAGPITGLSYGGATQWRDSVVDQLARRAPHIRCLDPMRAKQHLSQMESIGPF